MKAPLLMWSQLDYLKRHYDTAIKHLTGKKLANMILNSYEYRNKRVILKSLPPAMKIEATALCRLHCPGCLWHREDTNRSFPPTARLSHPDFVKIIKPIQNTLLGVSLSLRGDAFMNPAIFEMVSYCRDHDIGSVFPTHLSYRLSDEVLSNIIDCGLDHIIIAVDGADQETYEKYRKGGRLEWVLDNSKRLIELKHKKKSRTPVTECKFIAFQHNKHQYDEVKARSESMGFDRFSSVLDHGDPLRAKERGTVFERGAHKKQACFWLYRTMTVCYDGEVNPCCDDRLVVGNAIQENTAQIWNNDEYQALRKMFNTGKPESKIGKLCVGCCHYWGSSGLR